MVAPRKHVYFVSYWADGAPGRLQITMDTAVTTLDHILLMEQTIEDMLPPPPEASLELTHLLQGFISVQHTPQGPATIKRRAIVLNYQLLRTEEVD